MRIRLTDNDQVGPPNQPRFIIVRGKHLTSISQRLRYEAWPHRLVYDWHGRTRFRMRRHRSYTLEFGRDGSFERRARITNQTFHPMNSAI